jgi:hypothetical protein
MQTWDGFVSVAFASQEMKLFERLVPEAEK